eukprot:scaffold8488_cov101-Isochrysis_galbana.AAC.1
MSPSVLSGLSISGSQRPPLNPYPTAFGKARVKRIETTGSGVGIGVSRLRHPSQERSHHTLISIPSRRDIRELRAQLRFVDRPYLTHAQRFGIRFVIIKRPNAKKELVVVPPCPDGTLGVERVGGMLECGNLHHGAGHPSCQRHTPQLRRVLLDALLPDNARERPGAAAGNPQQAIGHHRHVVRAARHPRDHPRRRGDGQRDAFDPATAVELHPAGVQHRDVLASEPGIHDLRPAIGGQPLHPASRLELRLRLRLLELSLRLRLGQLKGIPHKLGARATVSQLQHPPARDQPGRQRYGQREKLVQLPRLRLQHGLPEAGEPRAVVEGVSQELLVAGPHLPRDVWIDRHQAQHVFQVEVPQQPAQLVAVENIRPRGVASGACLHVRAITRGRAPPRPVRL